MTTPDKREGRPPQPASAPENSPLMYWAFALIGVPMLAGAIVWLGGVVFAMFTVMPYGLIGFVGLTGAGLLIAKVVRDRMNNAEDDYYSKNIHE